MRKYVCYCCGEEITREEAERVIGQMEKLSERQLMKVVEHLGLVHCRGEKEMFMDDGTTIVCKECLRSVIGET